MKKRIFCAILAFAMTLGMRTIPASADLPVSAENPQYLTDEYYQHAYEQYRFFMDNPGGWDAISHDEIYLYTVSTENLNNNSAFQAVLGSVQCLTDASWSDIFIGQYDPDDVKVQYYVTALSSLLMTMEDNLSDVRASQARATSSMTWRDYIANGGSALAGGLSAWAGGNLKTALEICGISIDILGGSIDTFEKYELLQLTADKYLSYRSLLETLQRDTSDPLLVKAAGLLSMAVDKCFGYRMAHLSDYADVTVNAESDSFFSVLDKVIEETMDDALSPDEIAALTVFGKAASGLGSFKMGVDIGKFVIGDMILKSSDHIQRYYEMCAMASARNLLMREIKARDKSINSAKDFDKIPESIELLRALNYVNVRGAYCNYKIQKEDVGIASWIHFQFHGKEIDQWFDSVQQICQNIDNNLAYIIPKMDKHIGIAELVDGYWENNIQSRCVYQFFEDGTVKEFFIDPNATVKPENLVYWRTFRYRIEDNKVLLDWDKDILITLESVTKDAPYNWDLSESQLDAIPDNTMFLYETGWQRSAEDDPMLIDDNAMYLVKSTSTGNLQDNDSLTEFDTTHDPTTASLCSYETSVDEEHFPDAIFRSFVTQNCDTDQNGFLSADEITGATHFYVSGYEITDLTGIEYFTDLIYLDCSNNLLSSLNVRANTKLTLLECSWNHLKELDVSRNPALTFLDCEYNYITRLDLTANSALDTMSCAWNQLSSLDVSANIQLQSFGCRGQKLTEELIQTDGTYRLDFASLVGAENIDRVTVMSVTPSDAQYSVEEGVLTTKTALTNITYNYLVKGTDEVMMDVMLTLEVTESSTEGTTINVANFPDAIFRSYVEENCDLDHNGILSADEITAVQEMNVSGHEIADLTGIEYFTSLTYLDCSDNQLLNPDLSANAAA